VKTQTKQQKALASAADDAAFILEPLIVNGSSTGPVRLAKCVERILRTSLADAGLPVNPRTGVKLRGTTVEAEARKIAEKLIERGNVPLIAGRVAA
jgi:hypothetical protein